MSSARLALKSNDVPAALLSAGTRLFEDMTNMAAGMLKKQPVSPPTTDVWDSFFLTSEGVSDDFLAERGTQYQSPREAF